MKVKLDENIGQSVRRRLTDAGHDVSTIVDQDMTGAPDEVVYQTCAAEGRTLVTFDLDLANPFVFDPSPASGDRRAPAVARARPERRCRSGRSTCGGRR